jgi:hypothetical protein
MVATPPSLLLQTAVLVALAEAHAAAELKVV